MIVAYLAWKCEKLLKVVGELFQGDPCNYMLWLLLLNPLFTLDVFIVLLLRPESFVYLLAYSFMVHITYV